LVIIETKRLYLRDWKQEDLTVFYEMNSDPVIMEYFPKVLDENESNSLADKIKKHFIERGYGLWAVEEKTTNVLLVLLDFHIQK
jgi:ribosomal-protein-alanine N-acetyltransferase